MAERQVIQVRRTPALNRPPADLAEGELSVEMAHPGAAVRAWVGVSTDIDPSGRRLLSAPVGNAFAKTLEPFTVPEIDGEVTIEVDDTRWIVPGLVVFIEGGPLFVVLSVDGDYTITLLRVESTPQALPEPEELDETTRGIIDGSDAAPGRIGECLSAAGTGISIPGLATYVTTVEMQLPPGDWEISANQSATARFSAPTTKLVAGHFRSQITIERGLTRTVQTPVILAETAVGNGVFYAATLDADPVIAVRVSTDEPRVVTLRLMVILTGQTLSPSLRSLANSALTARRIR